MPFKRVFFGAIFSLSTVHPNFDLANRSFLLRDDKLCSPYAPLKKAWKDRFLDSRLFANETFSISTFLRHILCPQCIDDDGYQT
jgi:hypothetical protein